MSRCAIDEFVDAGADLISHAEAQASDRTIHAIKDCGVLAGVALNPATPLCTGLHSSGMIWYFDECKPGFGGQKYIPYTTQKIRGSHR